MAKKVKIHTATRVIFGETLETNPQMPSWMSAVSVADSFSISGSASPGESRTSWVLEAGDATKREATQQELDDADDDVLPSRVTKRELKQAGQDLIADGTVPQKVKDFVMKLANHLKVN